MRFIGLIIPFVLFMGTTALAEVREEQSLEVLQKRIERKKRRLDQELRNAERQAEQEVESIDDVQKGEGRAQSRSENGVEQFRAEEFVEFEPIVGIPGSAVKWADSSGEILYRTGEGKMYLVFEGRLRKGYRMRVAGKEVRTNEERNFRHPVLLPNKTGTIDFYIKEPFGDVKSYQYLLTWIKVPKRIGLRVLGGGGKVEEVSRGLSMAVHPSAYPQLYDGDEPVFSFPVEEDRLTIKIVTSNIPDRTDVGWEFGILNARQKTLVRRVGVGEPPGEFPWAAVRKRVNKPGEYIYYVDISVGQKRYKGNANRLKLIIEKPKPYSLLEFQIEQLSVFDASGSRFTGALSWNPSHQLGPKTGLRGNARVSLLNDNAGGNFVSLRLQFLATLLLANGPFSIEVGPGVESWFGIRGASFIAGGNLVFNRNALIGKAEKDSVKTIDRIYAGYSAMVTGALVHQFSIGVGLRF